MKVNRAEKYNIEYTSTPKSAKRLTRIQDNSTTDFGCQIALVRTQTENKTGTADIKH